jgi:Nucleotidyltransferase domain
LGIPEAQLETWSHQGAITTARATHEQIRNALNDSGSNLRGKNFEVFLQGSYKNDTNIRGDSDVDVVVQLNETFRRDLSALPQDQESLYMSSYPNATYLLGQFKADVLRSMRNQFGASSVSVENKSLKLSGGSGRLPSDTVVCLQYRKYQSFLSLNNQSYVEGIVFDTQDGRQVINFPKPHYDNGVTKNSATDGWFKPSVRMFKNARDYLVDHGRIINTLAPSYFLECLIYNVPGDKFAGSHQQIYSNAVNWLVNANLDSLMCQNRQLNLFGGSSEQWRVDTARQFISALVSLWNSW